MILLKLGGSLITDKDQPETPRLTVLRRLADEIEHFRRGHPQARLVIGHGSGSFGHHLATRHQTQHGAHARRDWIGMAEVWASANHLNRLVVDALRQAGVPAVTFPPSASALTEAGVLVELAIEPIRRALEAGLVPVVQGDVAFDRQQGSSIVSTEQVLGLLAGSLGAQRLLLAGLDPGVYADLAARSQVLAELRPGDLERIQIEGAQAEDVTGGMRAKVEFAFEVLRKQPELEVRIFSAENQGDLSRALEGEALGTRLRL
jgi:isopentenyl phosphate kinase